MNVELPRWSPNGKWVAFMGQMPDRPWRIFVIPVAGGSPEASKGDDNQGAPTWSPDGKSLVYGNVLCQEERTCAIHKIDLASGEVSTLPRITWARYGAMVARRTPYCRSKSGATRTDGVRS